ncbi:MAG: type I restriction endonuclease subunit R [Ignavibacteriaceae bacterium]
MIKFTDTSEKGFQKLIVNYLLSTYAYIESKSSDFDEEFCLNTKQLFAFIQETQPESFDFIQKKGERGFLVRLDEKLKSDGVIDLLRKGIKHYDKTINLFYHEPSTAYNVKDRENYQKNIFSVTQELVYNSTLKNRIDLTIFLNGIPVITMELKNPLSGQNVNHGIQQYKNNRSPRDKIFNFARCMVHFAADTENVMMCTNLKETKSDFLPFNKGLNDGSPLPPFGKGNPVNPKGLKTHYLWENILSKSSLSNIIDKYAQVAVETDEDTGKKKKKMIFPRYHQLTSVRKILEHAKTKGIGEKYLIQHSAGSGKSNSIAWLAHQLVSLHDVSGEHNIFDSVIVVTDRIVLDRQLRETIKGFAQIKGIVETITGEGSSKKDQLREAIVNRKKIIICTIQTFPHLLTEMHDMEKLKFAIIIDEAHSSQSGETSSKMNAVLADLDEDENYQEEEEPTLEDKIIELIKERRMIKNGSYFAFTATPKNKTLEMFGVPFQHTVDGQVITSYLPFHTYSMKQAIEEEFILDVLKNYTTYNSYYKLVKAIEDNPLFDTKKAEKKLRSYVEGHEFAIEEKSKIMIDHFHDNVHNLIKGEAKAMIVTKSILSAIKYKFAFDKYLTEKRYPYKTIIAFSGSKKYMGIEYTEKTMNNFPHFNNDIPKNFKRPEYRFLIVANKFQTGFDQPLLHTMYVDKSLFGVTAVQTLSRLNRSYNPYKKDTFVLDFYNTAEEIQEAFDPYYTSTLLASETDPNKLNELVDQMEKYEVFLKDQVADFCDKFFHAADRNQLDPILDSSVNNFNTQLNTSQQIDFKSKAKSFLRVYSYLTKITEFTNVYYEQLWHFLKFLVHKLFIPDTDDISEILEDVDMESYRSSKIGVTKIDLFEDAGIVEAIPVEAGGGKSDPDFDTLENIIKAFNQRFGDIDWTDKDKVYSILGEQIPADMKADEGVMDSIISSPDKQNAKISSDKRLEEIMQQYMLNQTEIFRRFSDDKEFRCRYQEFIFDTLWAHRPNQ